MLWTVFRLLIVVWLFRVVLQFGKDAIPVVLLVLFLVLVLRLVIVRTFFSRSTFFRPDKLHETVRTGRLDPTPTEQFADAIHGRTSPG